MLDLIEIGRVHKPHGHRGALRITIETEGDILSQESSFLFLEIMGSRVPYKVQSYKESEPGSYIIKLKYIDTPESAADYANSPVFVERERIGGMVSDHYYPVLTGYRIIGTDNTFTGTIVDIMEYPQQIMAKVSVSGHKSECLIPLVEPWIVHIDHDKRELTMDLPPGLV